MICQDLAIYLRISRRMVEDWSDPMANKYGLKATTKSGLGILRSNAGQKMPKKTVFHSLRHSGRLG
jgi:hypothetical protein